MACSIKSVESHRLLACHWHGSYPEDFKSLFRSVISLILKKKDDLGHHVSSQTGPASGICNSEKAKKINCLGCLEESKKSCFLH